MKRTFYFTIFALIFPLLIGAELTPIMAQELGDCSQIVFWSERGELEAFYTLDLDDNSIEPFLDEWIIADASLGFSPDGEMMAFVAHLIEEETFGLFIRDRAGNTNLITKDVWTTYNPVWSPDGNWLAFGMSGVDRYLDLYIVNRDGSGLQNITEDQEAAYYAFPHWHPNMPQIVYQGWDTISGEIFVIDLDAETTTSYTDASEFNFTLSEGAIGWTQDETELVVSTNRFNYPEYRLYFYNLKPAGFEPLYTKLAVGEARLSPNRDTLAVVITTFPEEESETTIAIIDLNTLEARELIERQHVWYKNLAWSPDGSQVAFSANTEGNFDIYTIDFDGSNLTRLTDHPANDTTPIWRPCREK